MPLRTRASGTPGQNTRTPSWTRHRGVWRGQSDGSLSGNNRKVSLTEIEPDRPVRFVFPPVRSSVPHIVLKVDSRDTAKPLRLFEWRERCFLDLGRPATRPFCAFIDA